MSRLSRILIELDKVNQKLDALLGVSQGGPPTQKQLDDLAQKLDKPTDALETAVEENQPK